MQFAREQGIATVHLSSKTHPKEEDFVQAMLAVLEAHQIDLILLAGYMKKVPKAVVQAYP